MSDRKRSFTKRGLLFLPPLLTALILVMVLSFLFAFKPSENAAAALDAKEMAAPNATVVLENGFEDGTTQGWVGRGAAMVAVTNTEAIGTYSLLTTGRASGWHGPSRNVLDLLEPDVTYEISASVRLVAGQSAPNVKMTIQRTPTGGSQTWDPIASNTNVTDTQWVTLHGTYSFTGEASELTLYLESDSATVEFYVDDVVIVELPPTWTYDFEDQTTQGWAPRGNISVTLQVTDTLAHDSDWSLLTTGRSSGWHGPSLDLLSLGIMEPGATYNIDAYVRLVTGTATSRINTAIVQTVDGTDGYPWIASDSSATDGVWIRLNGDYVCPTGEITQLTLYVESSIANAAYYIDDITITRTAPPPSEPPPPVQLDLPSVYQTLSSYFIVGAAIEPDQLDDIRHTELLTHHFNSITPENVMKPGPIHPSEATYNWTGSDEIVQFAEDHNMYVHGHALVWHQQNALWMFQNSAGVYFTPTVENKAIVLARLEDHIEQVVTRYQEVDVWDVVNEVIDPNQPDCLRHSIWYTMTGSDYITVAFQTAAQFAPADASLIINDYSTTDPNKRACLYRVVEDMLAAGVPVEGIGHQMHVNIEAPSANAIEQTLIMFSDLGLEQHITELDMSLYTNDFDNYGSNVPEEVLVRQGYRYRDIFNVLRRQAVPANIESVTFWGLADDHTWLSTWPTTRTNLPLLFDTQLQAKWAYWGIIDPTQLPVLPKELDTPAGTPAIDGNTEMLWELLPKEQLDNHETLTVSFHTRWDEDYLYVFVEVGDATGDTGDKVELFVDEDNSKSGAYDAYDQHYIYQNGLVTPSVGVLFGVSQQAGGYQLEIGLPLSMTAAAGNEIGFDLRITDGSNAEYPLSWTDLSNSQDTDTSKFGTLTLVDAVKTTDALPGMPVVDGIEDAVWAEAEEISTDIWVLDTISGTGSTAKAKTLWDGSNHLYVYTVVSDTLLSDASANAYEQDSIEVFLDQNNAKTEEYEASGDGQYRINFKNQYSFRGDASADTISSTTRILTITSGTDVITVGYAVEMMFTLNITPENGTLIGFDLQVNNDEDGDGTRDSVAKWNDPTDNSWQNTSGYGVLRFRNSNTLTLTFAGDGSGRVTSDPVGLDCGDSCSVEFSIGEVVTLTATADADSIFTGWSGEGCTGTDVCVVTLSQARNVTATFVRVIEYKVYLPFITRNNTQAP
ncbi:MAG: endo-1,4-beta-xylanase [Chloroflexota bacterium]